MEKIDLKALETDIKNYSYPLVNKYIKMNEVVATNTFFKHWADIIALKLKHEKGEQFSLRYYELIHNFCSYQLKKMEESANKKKSAKLVTFVVTTRVVVDENTMKEVEEEDAIAKAIDKICSNPEEYIIFDNVDECINDEECPFGTMDGE
jgi:hypothetical protein